MNNNIFLKNKKYNPDIALNYSKVLNERNNAKFEYKNEFKNKEKVDLNINKLDQPTNEMDKLIQKKLQEREKQEFDFKPSKNIIPSSNPNDFKEYNQLKEQQVKHEKKVTEKDNNFNDILRDLKSLGIIKK